MPLPSLGAEHAFRAMSGLIALLSVGTEAHIQEAARIRPQKSPANCVTVRHF